MRRGLFANKPIGIALITFAGIFFSAGIWPASAADIAAPPEVDPNSYTYIALEGGYSHLDGGSVQGYLVGSVSDFQAPDLLRERSLSISEAYYGRAELAHVSGTRFINGIGGYVHGWEAEQENVSEIDFAIGVPYKGESGSQTNVIESFCLINDPCPIGAAQVDRSLIEAGLKFFHNYGEAMGFEKLSFGIEPFVAFLDEDTRSRNGNAFGDLVLFTDERSSELDAEAYGALVALDFSHTILERTVLIGRVAGGTYYMNVDALTKQVFFDLPFSDNISSNYWAFRGQLALGLEQRLTDSFGIGVIGRLDYWSDYPTMNWPNFTNEDGDGAKFNSIASKGFLDLSIGARVTLNFN